MIRLGHIAEVNIVRMIARIVLGSIFVIASIDKIAYPRAFAKIVMNFNFRNPAERNHLASVYRDWKDKQLNIVIISRDIEKIITYLGIMPSDRIVLISNYRSAMEIFKIKYEGQYYLFDDSGKLVVVDNCEKYECFAKISLKRIVDKEYFKMADWFDSEESLFSIDGLDGVEDYLKQEDKEIGVLALFNKICDTCSGGRLIAELKELHRVKQSKICILIMVNDRFDRNDVANLKIYLNIQFPVLIADGFFSQQWDRLIDEYCDNELSDIIISFDNSGKITHIGDKKCDCYGKIFTYLYAL